MQLNYMVFVIPFFIIFIGVEYLLSIRKKQPNYRFSDSITNLNVGIGNQVVGLFAKLFLVMIYDFVYTNLALFHIPNGILQFILCFIIFDFLFYWAHRWGHEVNIFWGAHIVHHQSEEYNLTVALRQSWIHSIIAFVIFLPMAVAGFHPLIFLPAAGINTLYQFWIHTKLVGRLPKWIELWLNSPSHHRVHHGINPQYIDKNYGGVFIVWDRLFGTFEEEKDEVVYGITKPLNSWNPFWANVHFYIDLAKGSNTVKGLGNKFKLLFATPSYLGKIQGEEELPFNPSEVKKYDTSISYSRNIYLTIHFLLIITGLFLFINFFSEISWFYRVTFLGIFILSLSICGAILENKKWLIFAEYIRLFLLLISLNTFYYFWHENWFEIMLIASVIIFTGFSIWFTLSWTLDVILKRRAQRINS